jgi:MFS family permease
MYTLFFVVLGSSAAIWGGWLDRAGPHRAGLVAAVCWCGGLAISAVDVILHQLWMLCIGSGVIGGIGRGLDYISPVSTLVKWFPDRRGMATGMAIMGFGGGAMIGATVADLLMNYFRTPSDNGVWQTFLAMGVIYFVFMVVAAFGYRLPPMGWQPDGWTPPSTTATMITRNQVHLRDAHKTKQFWLICAVLALNVSASIGVIGMASPMLQEIFLAHRRARRHLHAIDARPAHRDRSHRGRFHRVAVAVQHRRAFLLGFFVRLHRAQEHLLHIFLLGIAMYGLAPWAAHSGNKALFVAFFCIILSMYGGGFATVPAYLADIFGPQFVGAIHGRLLSAWSTAGIVGPVVVNYIREFEIAAGVPRDHVYDATMYVLAGMLVAGFVCNYLVKPLADKWFMKPEDVAALQNKEGAVGRITSGSFGIGKGGLDPKTILFWAFVGIPLAWGVWQTLVNAIKIF